MLLLKGYRFKSVCIGSFKNVIRLFVL